MVQRTKQLLSYIIGASLIAALVATPPVFGQSLPLAPAGETVIDHVQARCDDIQVTLRRLHTTDALLRVNIGQSYNSISARLMARLNSRLALNRIDSTALVDISGRFDRERAEFAAAYTEYETALSSVLKTNCKTRATEYYAGLLAARDARLRLAETVKSLNASLHEYQVAVEALQASMQTEASHAS